MNTGNFQINPMASSTTMYTMASKVSAGDMSAPSAVLPRYHSAPSSTFAALLEQDFYPPTDGAELVQFLAHNGLGDYASYSDAGLSLKPNPVQVNCSKKEHVQQGYSNRNDILARGHSAAHMGTGFQEHIGQGPLSAILEHSAEETLVSQPNQQSPRENTVCKPMLAPSDHDKNNLIRQSSLPSDFLSRLAMEDTTERPAAAQQIGAHVRTMSPTNSDNNGGKVYLLTSNLSPRGVPMKKCLGADTVDSCKADEYSILKEDLKECSLLRQSSSPAGLLSQLTLDEFSTITDKVTMSSAQGLGLVHSHATGGWDDAAVDSEMQRIAALGQRKRGREADSRLFKGLPAADLVGSYPSSSNNYLGARTSNGDGVVTVDSVLCRSRAKRGCATHPRSIAERVRRMKISERMKKLLDLVPNLDKQAHTADMLDEVVEYVKLLQRQVQELSMHNNECNGMCHKKGSNAHEM